MKQSMQPALQVQVAFSFHAVSCLMRVAEGNKVQTSHLAWPGARCGPVRQPASRRPAPRPGPWPGAAGCGQGGQGRTEWTGSELSER